MVKITKAVALLEMALDRIDDKLWKEENEEEIETLKEELFDIEMALDDLRRYQ